MKPYRLTGRKAGRLFLKTANGILILCTLFVEPVLAQLGNPGRSGTSDESRPDLSGIPASEAVAIENACGYVKRGSGPAAYYQCLQRELAALQKSPGRPDLSGIPASEAVAIENACGYVKRGSGPAAYYQCLQRELAALQKSPGRPDLSGIPASEAAAIENACGYVKRGSGPAAYYQCLQRELAALQKSPGRPDLSGIPASEAAAIENACGYVKRGSGPAAYYQCLQRELAALQKFLTPNTKRLETSQLATKSANAPPQEATAEKGKEQNEKGISDKLVQEQTNTEQTKLAPAKPQQKQRGKSVDPKTTTEKYQTSPKEELGKEPSADIASPKLPQATHPIESTKTRETPFSPLLFLASLLLLVGTLTYRHIVRKPCIHCNTRTKNLNRICDACKMRMDYEKAKAQERETQEREARIRAEEKKRREEQAKAQEQSRRDNENARARERERQANEARKKAEENRRREEEERAQEERRRRDGARSNKREPDPYDVLQVMRGASKEEIKAAYFNMIKRYHPDKVSHLGKEFQDIAEKKAQEINRAYETLMAS